MISERFVLGFFLYTGFVQVIPLQSSLESFCCCCCCVFYYYFYFFFQWFLQPVKCFSSKVSLVCFQVALAIQSHHFQNGSTFKSILAALAFKFTSLANTEEFPVWLIFWGLESNPTKPINQKWRSLSVCKADLEHLQWIVWDVLLGGKKSKAPCKTADCTRAVAHKNRGSKS